MLQYSEGNVPLLVHCIYVTVKQFGIFFMDLAFVYNDSRWQKKKLILLSILKFMANKMVQISGLYNTEFLSYSKCLQFIFPIPTVLNRFFCFCYSTLKAVTSKVSGV